MNFMMNFDEFLTIASLRIGVPTILLIIKTYFEVPIIEHAHLDFSDFLSILFAIKRKFYPAKVEPLEVKMFWKK